MENYICNTPVFVVSDISGDINIPDFCEEADALLPARLFHTIDVIYIGDFPELNGNNALYRDGAIYISSKEPTNFDMLENLVHELAHALEDSGQWDIFDAALEREFLTKRHTLYRILSAEGYHINPLRYSDLEYNAEFDKFLAEVVGYPLLVTLTIGLFVSPYGATSVNEYFANGVENYILEDPYRVKQISPVLYKKIENIFNE
jgi:hypothetical protein